MKKLLLLGDRFCSYGEVELRGSGRAVGAISVGRDRESPSLAHKGDLSCPNEDALFIASDGPLCLLAVADGHFGIDGSHAILREVSSLTARVPRRLGELQLLLAPLEDVSWDGPAGTTLVLATVDLETGKGFGVSWGDSLAVALGPSGCRALSSPNDDYLHPGRTYDVSAAFSFALAPGDILCLCTDGVFECHYRSPATSLRPEMMQEMWALEGGAGLDVLVGRWVQAALAGVRGFPGGQDNIAIAAVV